MDTIPENTPKKQCALCKEVFPLTAAYFYKSNNTKDGFEGKCKQCRRQPATPKPVREGEKQCIQCSEFFPATLAYFHKSPRNAMGLSTKCKRCKGKGTNFGIIVPPKEHRPDEKYCPRCKKWLPKNTSYFGIAKKRKDGHYPYCKQCGIEDRKRRQEVIDRQQKAYRLNNHERLLERDRKRHKRYREKRNANSRQYYRQHQEARKAYARQYREAHLDKCRADTRRHYNLHKDQYFANVTARKARKQSIAGRYTNAQIQEQLKRQRYRCYYAACGYAKFAKRNGKYIYHVEHTFPLSRVTDTGIPANDMSYIVLACPACNLAKSDRYPWEWPEGGRLL